MVRSAGEDAGKPNRTHSRRECADGSVGLGISSLVSGFLRATDTLTIWPRAPQVSIQGLETHVPADHEHKGS